MKKAIAFLLFLYFFLALFSAFIGIYGWKEIPCSKISCDDCQECFESACPIADTIILVSGITSLFVALYLVIKSRKHQNQTL